MNRIGIQVKNGGFKNIEKIPRRPLGMPKIKNIRTFVKHSSLTRKVIAGYSIFLKPTSALYNLPRSSYRKEKIR
jgi:hypothetical protein